MNRMVYMKRFLPILLLLVTLGFGCETCDDYNSSFDWMQAQRNFNTTDQVLDAYPPLNINLSFDNNNTNTPTNSILEDLYPDKYGNSNSSNSITTVTSVWVNETDLNINESGTEASWGLQVVEGTDTASSTVPVIGADVTVQFSGGSGDTELIGITGSDGWVWWLRSKTYGAEQMYIKDITGDFPWNVLDQGFWQNTPALSITAEEAQ